MVDDAELLDRLRAGDEEAFATLVDRYHTSLRRLAASFVPAAVAEEVVQDTWLAVVNGIGRFEGRSSLKTWLFRILVNRARTTGRKERRAQATALPAEPAVDPGRFGPDGRWADPPAPWTDEADNRLQAAELANRVRELMEALPAAQRQIVTLRDLEGLTAADACEVMGISEANQRVLLHRGRSRLRALLERELAVG